MKMEQTECSETSAYKIQMPGNYPKESIQHTEHGESLKLSLNINFSIAFFPPRFVCEMGEVLCHCPLTLFVMSLDGPRKTGQIETQLDTQTLVQALRINLLKTKRKLIYIRNQSVPRCKHFPAWL